MTAPVWVRASWALPAARAMPKSVTFTWPLGEMTTLPGLTSRWMTPFLWANASAEAISAPISAARWGWRGPSVRISWRSERPFTYSMTMK